MSEISFEIADWLSATVGDVAERETLASLRIVAGPDRIPITEVEDAIAQTVRRHINVSAHSLARWLVVNWWRLRWEPSRQPQTFDWLQSHSLSAVGGDYVWPALTMSSDGEFIQLRLHAETSTDVCALRYLREITLDVPASHFEQAFDDFLDQVEARLELRAPAERELSELREELRQERGDSLQAEMCKLQALSGIDPGAAPLDWLQRAQALVNTAGAAAAEEILAVAPSLPGGLADADAVVSAMRKSATTVKLDWAGFAQTQQSERELPWERGVRTAHEFRKQLGIPTGPLSNSTFEQLLDARLPFAKTPWTGSKELRGGFRNGATQGRTAVLVTSLRGDSQRFYLARLVAAALRAAEDQHVLPVSNAGTALQKFERSFAQELLCPWADLNEFVEQVGTDDDGIADAAAHFEVSELVVRSALVNRGKLSRNRLQPS